MSTPPADADLGESTSDRMLGAAVELLEEHGSLDRVSLRAIAARVGVSPTAVYRHFDDHAALLGELTGWCWQRFDEAVFGVGADLADPCDRFLEQGLAYVDFARANPAIYRVLFWRPLDPTATDSTATEPVEARASYAKLVDVVGDILERNGDARPALGVAALVHTWIHGIATLDRFVVEGYPTAAEMVIELGVALGLAGVSPTAPGSSRSPVPTAGVGRDGSACSLER